MLADAPGLLSTAFNPKRLFFVFAIFSNIQSIFGVPFKVEGKDNYEYLYEINFELDKSAKDLFKGNLTIENLFMQLSSYKTNVPIIEGKTLLFFDEVQTCPDVLTSLKAFAMDGRFDVIASGSMLGIVMGNVSSYPVGYVETVNMKPMSFEEFLWAKGHGEELISYYETFYKEEKLVPDAIHEKLNELFLQYVVVGGMPEVVDIFVKTLDIRQVLEAQKRILNDYYKDLAANDFIECINSAINNKDMPIDKSIVKGFVQEGIKDIGIFESKQPLLSYKDKEVYLNRTITLR